MTTEVHILAVVDDEVLGSARVAGALLSAINNRAQKVIVGSVHVDGAVTAAAALASGNIQDE
jgi:redox-regulated HSP33 family molecular chaperone